MWIKEIVDRLTEKHNTNNPFEIASFKNIIVCERYMDDEILGFYKYIRRNKFIFINANTDESIKKFTCSHELGHNELHPSTNTPFLRSKTLFSVDKIEQEANRFAVELLLPDDIIYNYQDTNMTIQELGSIYGVPEEVAHLKRISD